ncbi:hypothetical protein FQR65_LT19602 [Abscondita terminalis]|nr:hypothetical protein FQR65_LT19602 [Abscondita terminalis]
MEPSPRTDKIFITGIAGEFPNSKNVEELYQNLNEKKQLCSVVDPKWKIHDSDLPPLVGRQPLNGEFDAGFFGVHHKHAEEMHHACRKILELSVEAVMDSGLNPSDLKGSKTGVFITSSEIESKNEWTMRQRTSPNFTVFGVSNSLLAAQISYHLQLEGPTVTIDGTCSSSVYLLNHAIKSIQSGRCDSALMCGLNAARNPNVISGYNQLGVLNPDKNFNVFDKCSTGYVKSEATVILFLQKLQDAKRVYAEILNIGTNCDGFKEISIMHPSFEMMADVFQSAYDEIGVDPSTVAFVECHVTGTQVGIDAEIKAVEKVFCADRITPLPIGSIKANIGHCEPASGLVSIIKILLGCQYNCILPNPQYYHLKLDVDAFRNGKVVVLTHPISLPNDQDVIIGCNNSGFGGTNGHIVLKHHSATRLHSKQSYQKRLICFSARTMRSLSKICNSISVGVTEGYISLLQNIFKQNVLNHWYRGYIIISDCTLSEQSLQCCNEKKNLCLLYPPGTKIWLSVFLRIKENSRASESFEKIRNILRVKGVDVLKLMSSKSELNFEDIILATVTLQLVVTDVLEDVIQDQIIFVDGFSSGIIAAAYAKKILQLEDALTIAFQLRKRLLNTKNLQVNLTKSLLFFCATVRKSPVISRPRNLATSTLKYKIIRSKNMLICTGNLLSNFWKTTAADCGQNQITLVVGPGKTNELCFAATSVLEAKFLAVHYNEFYETILDYASDPIMPKHTMCNKDIYKKLNLHGYNYKNEFCCLQEANLDGTIGLIKWNNWTTYLDAIEQFTLLTKELDHLYVPSEIERLVIDPQNACSSFKNCNRVLRIEYNKSSSTVNAPGVEMRNLKLSYIKKRLEKNPVLETYKFVPFKTELSLENSVRFLLVDSYTKNDQIQLLCPIIEKALKNEYRVKSTLSIFSNESYEDLNIDVVKKNLEQLPNDVNLVIVSNGSKRPQIISEIMRNRINCFVLSRESIGFETLSDVVSIHRTNQESLVLSRESCIFDRKIVNVGSDLDWLNQLQSSLTNNEKVLLVSQNDATSGILGLVNCLKQEAGDDVACMFLPRSNKKFDINDKFFKNQLRKNLLVNVFKDDQWGSYKHLAFDVSPKKCFHAISVSNGTDLSHVEYVEGSITSCNETLIDVKYVGVNFRDVMVATAKINLLGLNEYRSELSGLGFEFSGIDWRKRRVMGITSTNAFSNFISADKAITCPVPEDWSLEDAATVPLTYAKRTGGVGLSAVNICLYFNCNVFVTVGSDEKRNYFKTLYPTIADSHIGNSRDTTFEQMILKQTGGKGVDIIINSLSEDKLQASTRCLSRGGIFVELGKFDSQLNNPLPFNRFCGGRTFVGIHLDTLLENAPSEVRKMISTLERGVKGGYIKPLPRIVFDKEKVQKALHHMSVGKHTGKILLKFRNEFENDRVSMLAKPRFFCDELKVYIIVGGLGGFGIELADWLIGRGANKIILVSRNGPINGYQHFKLEHWRKLGHKVLVSQDDLTTNNGCVHLLKKANALGIVDGIFNLSVVLSDALVENQTKTTFNTVLTSKVLIIKNLDETSRTHCPDLRQFVVFSSYVSGRGNSSQTNYGMANSAAERICEKRKSEGYPALAIQWGLIGDVGLVAEIMSSTNNVDGVLEQKISSCLKVLDSFLTQDEVIVSSTVFDDAINNKTSKSEEFLDNVVKILAITNVNHVSMHGPLSKLGMDSMSTLQLMQFLDTEHNMYFTPRELRNINLHM